MNRFVLGIGSQRAGSTLLHHCLDVASDVFMHPLKELHYFDTLYGVRSTQALRDFSLRQLGREIDRIVGSNELDFFDSRYRCYLRSNRILGITPISEVNYLDLFRPFVGRSPLLGEATPEYMLLDDEAIRSMRSVIGADAVVILVCRNPVRRLLSAVKLMSTYNNLQLDDQGAREWLVRMLEAPNPWMRAQDGYNDYIGAIRRYSTHFRRVIAIGYDRLSNDPEGVAKAIGDAGELRIDRSMFVAASKEQKNELGPNFNVGADVESILLERYRNELSQTQEHLGMELLR
jgi:hypothetical protein